MVYAKLRRLNRAPWDRPAAEPPAPDMARAVRGAILLSDPPDRVDFRFSYGEIPVAGAIVPDGGAYMLAVDAMAGVLPYTAEDRATRSLLRRFLAEMARHDAAAVSVDRHQIIRVTAERRLDPPLTAGAVLAGLVALMMESRLALEALAQYLPELDLALPQAGAAAAVSSPGGIAAAR